MEGRNEKREMKRKEKEKKGMKKLHKKKLNRDGRKEKEVNTVD
jgi:hypothetical protein